MPVGFVLLLLCCVPVGSGECFVGVLFVGFATGVLRIGTLCSSVQFFCIDCIGLSWRGIFLVVPV